ncbi:cytochrome P450 [Phanerochaete sordida]|uniref:Cytochrome P450 n=1 Tax=Phanerochaete sordida TaxID=48140 RepID=A0A9P3G4D9_9APHY|nr:cytochrome P450 [Phanerochaete sordida]
MPPPGVEWALYLGSAVAGTFTWSVLHRSSIQGDTAALAYFCAYATLYAVLYISSLAENAFSISLQIMVAYTCSALLTTSAYRLGPWHPLAHLPGPPLARLSSLWLTCVSLRGRRHLVIDRLHARYGVFVRIGPNIISINSPAAQQIYSAATRMLKSDSYRAPGHDGVVALFFKQQTEKLHSDRKRVWGQLFTKEGLAQLTPFLERRTFQLLECLKRRQAKNPDQGVNLEECLYHWSYDFMGDFVFGGCNKLEMMKSGDPTSLIEGGKSAMILLDSIGQTPWLLDILWRIPLGGSMHRMARLGENLMKTRLQAAEYPSFRDLVSFLTEDDTIPERDLNLDALVAIQGGSDNTSITLTLAVFFVTTEPKYSQRLRFQLSEVFSDPTGPFPDDKLNRVPLLDAVINEALRLGSPFFLLRIVPVGGVVIDGQYLPADTIVALAAYTQQIDPDNFSPDPLSFRPERWLPEELGSSGTTNRAALSSFSSGPHACVARQLAYMEMRHVLARLVLNLDISPVQGFDPEAFRGGIMNMRTTILEQPFMVVVRNRRGTDVAVGG